MRTLFIFLVALAFPIDLAAQCVGGVPEGDLDPTEACRICRNAQFEYLPVRTACDAERRVQCDAIGVFRIECKLVSEGDPQGPTTCGNHYRFPDNECPSGFVCEAGFCLSSCTGPADCRTGYQCSTAGVCELPREPDMGNDGEDMGQDDDTGIRPSDMGEPPPDGGDGGGGDDGGRPGDAATPKRSGGDGGCCRVTPSGANPLFALVLAFLAVLATRVRTGRA